MQFHKKHGVFEACKKVCEDFFDTLNGAAENSAAPLLFYSNISADTGSTRSAHSPLRRALRFFGK